MNHPRTPREAAAVSSRAARRQATRLALGGAVLTVTTGVSIVAVAGSLPLVYQVLPLALSVVVLGLPHGAVDHLVLPRARAEPVSRRSLAFVGLVYLAVGGLYAAVWLIAPAFAFALFLLVTVVHWGQGDVAALVEFLDPPHLDARSNRYLTLVVRGGVPMLVPLIAFPDQYAFVARSILGVIDPGAAVALEPAFTSTARTAVAAGFGSILVASLALGFVRTTAGGRTGWLVDAVETLALVGYFSLVPPVLAIGLYFCFWHSLRHVLRTMLLDATASAALARDEFGTAARRFARDATPLTLGGLAVLVGVGLLVPTTPASTADLLGIYLVAIAVLTLPHVVIVTLLDRERGIWSPRSSRASGR